MPGEQRVRGDDIGKVKESFAADGLSSYGQSAALIILEARTPSQLFFENADFLLKIFDDELLLAPNFLGGARFWPHSNGLTLAYENACRFIVGRIGPPHLQPIRL